MSKEKEYIEKAEENILHTYNRYPVVLDHGKGVRLYDVDGKEYLDFAAGIGVQSLGYGNPEYTEALKAQVDKLTHISNLYYSVPMMEAAQKVRRASGLEKVFFTNSGTEAIEGALKAARKYSYTKYGPERYEIIAMNHSFHGRSMGALSVTGKEAYRTPFEPLVGGVRFADYNDLESVKAQITDKTCAIILETIQGEGGIYVASEEFLRGVTCRELLENAPAIREKFGDRAFLRAFHFVNENERVGKIVDAVRARDYGAFKKLIIESGNSSFRYLQNVYASSAPEEQGMSVALASGSC